MGARSGWSELEIPEPRPAPSIASPLLLGLFMLMLAIFIIMVSFSTVAASRFREVAQSMSDTFRSAQATVNFMPAKDDSPGTGNFPELGRLIQAAVPGARAEETPGADRLRLRLPTTSLFGRGRGVALTAGARALVADLATQLAARPDALRYDVEYLIGRGKDGDWPLAAARAAVVAEALIAAGAPRANLAVGLMPGGIETSSIVFLAHAGRGAVMEEEFLPAQSFEAPAQPVWLISFADLISLLLCFFVMLFAMSSIELQRWRAVVVSTGNTYQGPDATSRSDASEPWMRRAGQSVAGATIEAGADLDYVAAVLQRRIDDDPDLAGAALAHQPGALIVSLPADELFEIGRAVINPNARLKLAAVGRLLLNVRNQVDVRGHGEPTAVARALKLSPVANWELSLSRASNVADELQRGGYVRNANAIGLSDTRYDELPGNPADGERDRLARRVDVIIRAYRPDAVRGAR